jgi:hypothetical protein
MESLRTIYAPVFHGVAGRVILLGPVMTKGAPKRFLRVGIGGVLTGLGGIALALARLISGG